ncbi:MULTISPECIES: outer membrane protein assembly factor BamE [Salinivibrio]|jgi:outer membrane protein assembly factor BamE|uniref:Outer membrane protein assembly factor BamE n=2 Tax=Salinivibrio TaxID=51366 RepID=A0ABY7LB44_9GAMM|nr:MULTISPECIES: outer membrane protein assembly factor BamE [Salinivibrio]ODP96438.1 outer membrane protein assembly factor BamE [Salinivibrio sp. DV]OOF08125.1 outer membrane protein assembly factor BamE [Salinivibrio sp. PR5]OOF11524.1 outer membrane protein assembly factor BamE [Salinivibrio sp. PR919]OOF19069.1 outer membrane protein assembly factor BamE [Salinivibrio sp. PR932]OOF21794.1 outer membrane protein assembly factor BamE [Salinivibrio proteolyticus]
MGWTKAAIAALMAIAITGCSYAEKLVYRVDINQGNYIEEKAVDSLKFGMTKEQVKFLLGPPMLVESGYPNTWYFVQWQQPGHQAPTQKDLVLSFDDNNQLVKVDGDFTPGESFFEAVQ